MRTIFMDTVGLIALWDRTDQWHDVAKNALSAIKSTEVNFVTTTFVLLECGNAAARRPYRSLVDDLRERLAEGGKLLLPTEDDQKLAWKHFKQGQPGDAGIVDHTTFIVMRRLCVREAFTNDRHFKKAGFLTLF